ncbi:hypothetical protein D3Z62_11270 [Lachnospiraceae bacterium]|nr:hypothetical protein [Lachnospiraceae bacterium]
MPEKVDYEIDLLDLMFYCLEKWRVIIFSMLIFAIVLGGYKYRTTVKENLSKQQEILFLQKEQEKRDEQEKKEKAEQSIEAKNEKEIKEVDTRSIKSYKLEIEKSEHILQRQEAYLKQSVVMQLDPYHISTGTLSFYMEGGDHVDTLLSAYQVYISDGSLAKDLHSTNSEISVEDLRYLISFTNSANRTYELGNNQVIQTVRPGDIVFQIQIKMPDSDLCEFFLKQAQQFIIEYSNQLQTEMNRHNLTLLSSSQAEITDLDIEKYQSTIHAAYTSSIKNLQTLESELDMLLSTEEEEKISEESVEEISEDEQKLDESEEIILVDPISSTMIYVATGLLMGAFLSCIALALLYIMSGRLQNTKNFKAEYGIPVLGFIYNFSQKGKFFGFIDRWIYRLQKGVYAKIEFDEQMKITIANIKVAIEGISTQKKIKKVMLAGTISENEAAELCSQLNTKAQDFSLSSYRQIVFCAMDLQDLVNYDALLFIEKKGVSYSELIFQEKKLALDRKVDILGAIVIS